MAGLNLYLRDNEFSSVEAHDLRLAFEEVTGLDLNPFFNQWYFSSGHPILDVDYEVLGNNVSIVVNQTQELSDDIPIFSFDVRPIVYYLDGSTDTLSWTITKQSDKLIYTTNNTVGAVVFDGTHNLLSSINEPEQSSEWYAALLRSSNEYVDIKKGFSAKPELSLNTVSKYKSHSFHEFRMMNIENYEEYYSTLELENILTNDNHYSVRKKALEKLAYRSRDIALRNAKTAMLDESYNVQSEALYVLYAINPSLTNPIIDSLLNSNPLPYLAVIADIKSSKLSLEDLRFYETYINDALNQNIYYVLNDYIKLSKEGSIQQSVASLKKIKEVRSQSSETYKKYFLQKGIDELVEHCQKTIDKYDGPDKSELLEIINK